MLPRGCSLSVTFRLCRRRSSALGLNAVGLLCHSFHLLTFCRNFKIVCGWLHEWLGISGPTARRTCATGCRCSQTGFQRESFGSLEIRFCWRRYIRASTDRTTVWSMNQRTAWKLSFEGPRRGPPCFNGLPGRRRNAGCASNDSTRNARSRRCLVLEGRAHCASVSLQLCRVLEHEHRCCSRTKTGHKGTADAWRRESAQP